MTEPEPQILDDERADFDASENGEWKSIGDADRKKLDWSALASRALEEREDVPVQISRADLLRLKAEAERIGVPYRSLISTVVHRYAAEVGGS